MHNIRTKLPVFLIGLFSLVGNVGFVFSQDSNVPPEIINPDNSSIPYCNEPVPVAPNISLENLNIDEETEGIKISIANYKKDEDELIHEDISGLTYTWNIHSGYLEIKGIASEETYREAVSKVYYTNTASSPTLGNRDLSISLLDADYLPSTEHFYRFVASDGIHWDDARSEAEATTYYGLQGYLATIRSQDEQDFILTKTEGTGWIGASDAEKEGTWKWVTGPDAGTVFWQGNAGGSKVDGEYNHWGTDEPNNLNGEDYAHIMYSVYTGYWNDLPIQGSDVAGYIPQGYLIEFGGMENVELHLVATAKIAVQKIAFSDERNFEICAGESQQLNVAADPAYNYTWSPEKDINSVNISNPVVTPDVTTTYQSIGQLEGCIDTAYFQVEVNPLPVSNLPEDTVLCEGSSIVLDPGEDLSYEWDNGETDRTITVTEPGYHYVVLSNENCSVNSEIQVDYSEKPVYDTTKFSTLVCGSKTQKLEFDFSGKEVAVILRPLDPAKCNIQDSETLTPTIEVSEFGEYFFELEMLDASSCTFYDTLKIGFHNQPDAIFMLDEEECQGYNLKLHSDGIIVEEAIYSWFYNSEVYKEGTGLNTIEIPLGFGELERSVGLKINEQGCIDSYELPVKVTPNVDVVVDDQDGCTPHETLLEAVSSEPAAQYEWDFGDGSNSNSASIYHEFVNSSDTILKYDVTLTVVSTEGCENTGLMKDLITVFNKPTIDFSFSETDCNEAHSEINYVGSATNDASYYWDLSELQADEIIHNPGTTGESLEINRTSSPKLNLGLRVVSEYGCKSDSLTRTWKRVPLFKVVADTTEGCPPLHVNAQAIKLDSVDQISFDYFAGDGTLGTGNTFAHDYTSAASTFEVKFLGTSTLTTCVDTVSLDPVITTYGVPKAEFDAVPDEVLISDPVIDLQNRSLEATSYVWDFGDSYGTSDQSDPQYRYAEMGFYTVVLQAMNDLACIDSTSRQITVTFDKLYPPNAFSPNASLEEDREFRLYAEGVEEEGYRLLLFSRWGEQIFESDSPEIGWDGMMKNGKFAPSGVYTWVLQYTDFTGKKHSQQGRVTLLF